MNRMGRTAGVVLVVVGLTAGVSYLIFTQGTGAGCKTGEMEALRTRVDELARVVASLQQERPAVPAVAAAASASERQETPAPKAVSPEIGAPEIPSSDREAIFALIKEERELREREKQTRQSKQLVDAVKNRVKQTAERLQLSAETSESLVKLYVEGTERDLEIRRAYPIADGNSQNADKRQLELDAASKELDSRVANLIPAEMQQDWNRSTRWIWGAVGMMEANQSDTPFLNMMGGPRGGWGGPQGPGGGNRPNNGPAPAGVPIPPAIPVSGAK